MDYIEKRSPAYRRALIGMLLGSLVTYASLYCPQTLISVFSEQYHVSPATASFTISFTTGALAIFMFILSIFSNAWSRKGIMSISLLLTSLLTILSAFGHNFHFLLITRLLIGISLAGFPAVAMTYISEEFSPRSIGGIMGVYVAGNGVGAFVGRVVIGTLTDLFSWQTALLGLGAFSLLCSLCFWLMLPNSHNFQRIAIVPDKIKQSIKASLNNKNLLLLYGIGFLLMGVYVTLFNYIGYPLRKAPYHLSQTTLGFIFVVNLIGSWGAIVFGKMADRYPRSYVISWAAILLLSGTLLTLHGSLIVKIIGLVIFAFGFFAGHTIACGWVGIVAPAHSKAQAAALYLLFYYTGSSLIGWSGGYFWSFWGWPGVVGLVCVLSAFTMLFSFQTTNPVCINENQTCKAIEKT
jgi:MFS transporter, YNFM family, putative membrane transport protein